ncbi:MAG: hypothetical protein WCP81_02290 [Actinomycetes bacterium]|jgi:hypothetical protein
MPKSIEQRVIAASKYASVPVVMDSTAAQTELGLRPTPVADVLAAVVDAYRAS